GIESWQEPISECVRHSMLEFDGRRYRMHSLVRRFALDQLGDAAPEWQARFVDFFVRLVIGNDDVNDLAKLAVLDTEYRNALAAAEMAEGIQDWKPITILSEYLGDFLLLRGLWSERERLNRRALAAARAAGDHAAEGRALGNLGNIYQSQGRWQE